MKGKVLASIVVVIVIAAAVGVWAATPVPGREEKKP